jgi:gluconokinase
MIVVLMGVCGCGKSTIGRALAAELDWPFLDADTVHPQANVAKMAAASRRKCDSTPQPASTS